MSEWQSSGATSSEESAHPTKLGVRMEGPSTIEHVHVNGNLTIILREGITERISIRRDLLYCWPFHIPLWRQFLAWIVFEVFTFYLWSIFSISHSSELWVEFFWIHFLFVHLWQSKSCHGGEECRAHGNNLYGQWKKILYEFTDENLHIWSRTINSQMWIHIYEVVPINSRIQIPMISILWFRISFWFLPWARQVSLSQKRWEGALAKYIANNRTSTRQNCNI